MGIKGFQSYIHGLKGPNSCFKKHELSDCWVVIDGSNIAYYILKKCSAPVALFGDYDVYYEEVIAFMLALKKCNLNAIFLFDGGSDSIKLSIKIERREKQVEMISNFCDQKISLETLTSTCSSLLAMEVFADAARTMGFICIQCDLEADIDSVAVARNLKCPILSDDSDYFLCDVQYIPLKDINYTPIKYAQSDKYYLECLLFDANIFLKSKNLDKSLLPVLATLLDNQLRDTNYLIKFFAVLHLPFDGYLPRKMKGLTRFLRKHNANSALEFIKKFTSDNGKKFSEILKKNTDNFSRTTVSEVLYNEITSKFGQTQLRKSDISLTWPKEIAKLFAETWIPGFLMNIILHQIYFCPLQVENIYDTSSHLRCLKLIKKIYGMLTLYLVNKDPLSLYLVQNGKYQCLRVEHDPTDVISLDSVLKDSQEMRLKLLCDIVGVSMEELKIVPFNSWAILIMMLIYWVKEFKNSISRAHVDAIIIMIIANKIVQSKVNHRNATKFLEEYMDKIQELKSKELTLTNSDGSFEKMLENITKDECILAQEKLIPLRQSQNENLKCISTIHLFVAFQTCIFYIAIINGLLNYPLPYLKVQEFYSASLLFNLYKFVELDRCGKFGTNLFLPTPNLHQVYKYLREKLFEYICN